MSISAAMDAVLHLAAPVPHITVATHRHGFAKRLVPSTSTACVVGRRGLTGGSSHSQNESFSALTSQQVGRTSRSRHTTVSAIAGTASESSSEDSQVNIREGGESLDWKQAALVATGVVAGLSTATILADRKSVV